MAQNVHHQVVNKRGYHRLKPEPYLWSGYVPNMTMVTTFSTRAQILIKDSSIQKR